MLGEADDVVTAVKALTTPENAPIMHLWDSDPEAASWAPEKVAEHHFTVAEALRPGLLAIIADHLAFNAPVVLEGDYVLPDLAVGPRALRPFAAPDWLGVGCGGNHRCGGRGSATRG